MATEKKSQLERLKAELAKKEAAAAERAEVKRLKDELAKYRKAKK